MSCSTSLQGEWGLVAILPSTLLLEWNPAVEKVFLSSRKGKGFSLYLSFKLLNVICVEVVIWIEFNRDLSCQNVTCISYSSQFRRMTMWTNQGLCSGRLGDLADFLGVTGFSLALPELPPETNIHVEFSFSAVFMLGVLAKGVKIIETLIAWWATV